MIVTTVADDADGTAAAAATVVTSCHYRTGLTRLLLLLLGHTFKRGRRLTFPKHASFVDFRTYFFVTMGIALLVGISNCYYLH